MNWYQDIYRPQPKEEYFLFMVKPHEQTELNLIIRLNKTEKNHNAVAWDILFAPRKWRCTSEVN